MHFVWWIYFPDGLMFKIPVTCLLKLVKCLSIILIFFKKQIWVYYFISVIVFIVSLFSLFHISLFHLFIYFSLILCVSWLFSQFTEVNTSIFYT